MTAHELARLHLAGPDVEAVALSDSSQSYDCEYKIEALEPRRLYWMRNKTAFGEHDRLSQKNDVVKSSNGVFVVSPLDRPPVDVVVLKGGDWLDSRP